MRFILHREGAGSGMRTLTSVKGAVSGRSLIADSNTIAAVHRTAAIAAAR